MGHKLQVTSHKFKNKKILVTAGPTWVPIDGVRVISNVASGQTGILLAEKLRLLGAKVTLILGPVSGCGLENEINVLRFRFFDELKSLLAGELRTKKYDIVIHAAAVSDYKLKNTFSKKLSSDRKSLSLTLEPTEKLIDLIKKIDKNIFLVGFKFEPGLKKESLIREAFKLIRKSQADLVVANTVNNGRYEAYLVDASKVSKVLINKNSLTTYLIKSLG